MSETLEIYVISNAYLFREAFNAIALFCNTDGFRAATYIGALIGIVATSVAYVQKHDVMVFLKWFVIYFLVMNVLIGVKESVVIINTSDASETPAIIDNVPLGIALPAHIITAIGYDFGSDLEIAFHMPDALQYNTTGMLFGSNLFRLSLASNLDDADAMNEMNDYVRSCVIGDILINHKYSINDLLNSADIWGLMSSNPSPIRGIFIDGVFNTCQQATTDLTAKINNYTENSAPGILAKFIPSHKIYAPAAVSNLLQESYQGLLNQSETATQILKQNISINAFRSGIINYAAETGSTAGMQNYANTVAMQNTRMAWATSSHMGVVTIPYIQVVVLLLTICLFPVIAILTLMPNFGLSVFKNYIYTIIWLESFPIMFTILNMAMNFYLSPDISGTVYHVTLSNINRLAQEHSDIAGIAGYLILAIPFLSIGIVKGMASTFTQASQYLGGMMHSIGQGAASSVAMGNYSLGNISTGNATANSLSANKYDTNFSTMEGLATQQLGNGSTITTTPSGQILHNTATGTSHLTTGINVSSGISTALSNSADKYKSDAQNSRVSMDNAISSAASNALSYDSSTAHSQALSDTSTTGVNSQVDHAMSTMKSIAQEVQQKEGGSVTDAYRKMAQLSTYEKVGIATPGGKIFGANASMGADGMQQAQTGNDRSYYTGVDHNISQRQIDDFRSSMSVVENYSRSQAATDSSNYSNSIASRVGDDFRNAQTYAHSMSADLSTGERLSQQASYVASNSTGVQSDFTQPFVDYVHTVDPVNANRILNDQSASSVMQRQSLAENFMHQYASHLEKNIVSQSSSINPEQNYQEAMSGMSQSRNIHSGFASNAQALQAQASSDGIEFNQSQMTSLENNVSKNYSSIQNSVQASGARTSAGVRDKANTVEQEIAKDKIADQKGITRHFTSATEDILKKI